MPFSSASLAARVRMVSVRMASLRRYSSHVISLSSVICRNILAVSLTIWESMDLEPSRP